MDSDSFDNENKNQENENVESCVLRTAKEEKQIIEELMEASTSILQEGELCYGVTLRWWKEWQEYIDQDDNDCQHNDNSAGPQYSNGNHLNISCRPGQIYNFDVIFSKMTGDDVQLEINQVTEGCNYIFVPQEVWRKLVEWYKGGPDVLGKLIIKDNHKGFVIDLYPIHLQLFNCRNNILSNIQINKRTFVRELYRTVCTILNRKPGEIHLWSYFGGTKTALLDDFDKPLECVNLFIEKKILWEEAIDEHWPSNSGMHSEDPSYRENECELGNSTSGISRGMAGLLNLGNTCFMNSAIQCLVHTPPLVEYFLQDYRNEINTQNPLGYEGELAQAFGQLLRKLWYRGHALISPVIFKYTLDSLAPQFSGHDQHDSQEFLSFLLDGLHEDLNRVKEKPYIETSDSIGRLDEEVADEHWGNHKARNDSVIVDAFQGQYKSTLTCPVCNRRSTIFEPFMCLSLPLPSVSRTMTIMVFCGDGSVLPMSYTVNVQKHGCFKDLRHALTNECCLKADESLLLVEVYNYRIHRHLKNPLERLSSIDDNDTIVAYRLPSQHEKLRRLEILHVKGSYKSDLQNYYDLDFIGTPLVTYLREGIHTGADIQDVVDTLLKPLLQRKHSLASDQVNPREENGTFLAIEADEVRTFLAIEADEVLENCNPYSGPHGHSNSNVEPETISNGRPSFQLWLYSSHTRSCYLLKNDTLIESGGVIRVLLEWRDKEYGLYNISFLKNPPVVFESELVKWEKQWEEVSLFSCLEAFLKEEPLGLEDTWYCPACNQQRQATKKLDLWRLPDILVIHLKRFSYNHFLDKLDTFVKFPIGGLDLSGYVQHKDTAESHVYELYAVSNHYGSSFNGHYTAHAKLVEENQWYHFDDNLVSPVNEDAIETAAAYVLFYRRSEAGLAVEEPSQTNSPKYVNYRLASCTVRTYKNSLKRKIE
eukprot:TRINITY_DN6585_c0_g2_i2.p1 TRINITY_DN6585_c0_g2~~TRINITY_DN6585_c0_g2_i2.p1  ORF type:complete len:932 (+),score=131.36 TRINITY_DN6585_c0_g2_i2:337-3132(+)